MGKLRTLVRAKVPIIRVTTTDLVNVGEMIQEECGREVVGVDKVPNGKNALYWCFSLQGDDKSLAGVCRLLSANESTLIVVNGRCPVAFEAGELPVSAARLTNLVIGHKDPEGLRVALGGLTLKEAREYLAATMARDKSATPEGVLRTRREYFQEEGGLLLVDTRQPVYLPQEEVKAYAEQESNFFLAEKLDPRLRPRGILLKGEPGTGKSSAAKYLARSWGVPLFALDVGTSKGRYVGDSEAQLAENLRKLDAMAPCVVLLDEIEKMFPADAGSGDAGTSSNMLARYLWWSQEHESRVLQVITTNDVSRVPPEIYRPGRIDVTVRSKLMASQESTQLLDAVLDSFRDVLSGRLTDRARAVKRLGTQNSASFVTQVAHEAVKDALRHKT